MEHHARSKTRKRSATIGCDRTRDSKTVISVEAAEAGDAIIEDWDLTPRLGEIFAPTLIVVGKDDFICPPSQAKIMHEGIPNSELVVFESSGHFTHVEEPEAFFDTVRGWLGRS